MDNKALLDWYLLAGVDEVVGDSPVNRLLAPPEPPVAVETSPAKPPAAKLSVLHIGAASPIAAATVARAAADRCQSLAELREAVFAFDGCSLKKTASKTVFADGNPDSGLMIIGEAPGAQEDLQGIPFCGPSGALLDKMLASIGLSREGCYITNTVFWRPPGNRQPSPEETAICLPLVEKHIALVRPKLILLAGGTATSTLLGQDSSLSRLRGKIHRYSNQYLGADIRTLVTYHPSYLLRTPAHKKYAWSDLLKLKKLMEEH
ncbi:MAG: uracil-DNA glycosylase [Alphaproteobacteria bacterium]|nr:uracil-DNA glycosylase [Alphaproteobacteria bacterium]